MSDIVEIALKYLTDHADFEKLASEIMLLEGYRSIKPLGGVSDSGKDAIQESYFISEGKSTIIFQYSLVEYLPGKIKDTIEKLNNANVDFNELVIVTPHNVSSQRQDDMKRDARTLFDVSVNIYDKKTIINRLSDYSNGIFSRHFPDIEKQLKDLISSKPNLSASDANVLEVSMLKSSLVFGMSKEAPRVRDTVFDALTFSILSGIDGNETSVADILAKYQESTGMNVPPSQLEASLKRLTSKGFVSRKAEFVGLTKLAKQFEEANTIKANEATESLINDVLQQIVRVTENTISKQELGVLGNNTRVVLIKLFSLFGIEISEKILKDKAPQTNLSELSDDLLKAAESNLRPELGRLLVSCISEILKHPTEEQAQTLSYWSLSYIGVQLMNIDPNLRQLQAVRFSKKIFILDTDFILDCVVRECPLSRVYLELVNTLKNFGCRIIVPNSCVKECVTHARISPRTYHHFGEKLLSLMDVFVDEVVWNVFVKGYYFGRIHNEILPNTTFNQYLSNYYEPVSPERYFIDVIRETFPPGIEIIDIATITTKQIPEDIHSGMTQELVGILSAGNKSRYRSANETQDLAATDATLFLQATAKSQSDADFKKDEILGGCCYLVTSSTKYLRASKTIGVRDIVTSRPQTLVALLDAIGGIKIDPKDFVLLFENPLIINAVQQAWDDVEQLLDNGINLRDKSLSRLRWDLDQYLHQKISALAAAEAKAETSGEESDIESTDEIYADLVKSASSYGYGTSIPGLDVFLGELQAKDLKAEELAQAYNELLKKYNALETQINHFGKRKQNFLKRMARS